MIYRKSIFARCITWLFFLLPVIMVFFIVWLRSNLVALEYELGQYQKLKDKLIEENRLLILQKEKLTSLKNIEYVATKKLGLSITKRKKVFYVKVEQGPKPYVAGFSEDSNIISKKLVSQKKK